MSPDQFNDLIGKIQLSESTLLPLAARASEGLCLSLAWVGHYLNVAESEPSSILLKGAYGSAVESVSLTAFGMVRPAMLALRSHYELSLQYLYFKDHPIELQSLLDFRVQGPLPAVVKKYLRDHLPQFESRNVKLSKVARRKTDEVYSVLSGVAHGNAVNSVSLASVPSELVEESGAVSQSIDIFFAVSETLSDLFLAEFGSNWLSVPSIVRTDAMERFPEQTVSTELSF